MFPDKNKDEIWLRKEKVLNNRLKGYFKVPRFLFNFALNKKVFPSDTFLIYLLLVALAGWDSRSGYFGVVPFSISDISKKFSIPLSSLARKIKVLQNLRMVEIKGDLIIVNYYSLLFVKTSRLLRGKTSNEQRKIFADILTGDLKKMEEKFSEEIEKEPKMRKDFSIMRGEIDGLDY